MKIYEFLDKHEVDEAPQGIISRGLNKLGAKFLPGKWGAQAQGKLNVGAVANKLYKDYYTYLGSSGQQPSMDSLSRFLQTQKIMGDVVKQASSTAPVKNPAAMSTGEVEKFLMGVSQELAAGNPVDGGGAQQSAAAGSAQQAAPAAQSALAAQTAPQAAPGTNPTAQPGVAVSQKPSVSPSGQAPAGVAAQHQPGQAPGQTAQPAPTPAQGATQDAPAAQPGAPTDQPAKQAPAASPQSGFRKSVADIQKPAAAAGGFKTTIPKQNPATPAQAAPAQAAPATAPAGKAKPAWAAARDAKNAAAISKPVTRTTTIKMPDTKFSEARMLKALAEAAYSGKPISRKAYFFATKMLEARGVGLRDLGIRVVISESTASHIVLKKF
jgi:hypothetical protein